MKRKSTHGQYKKAQSKKKRSLGNKSNSSQRQEKTTENYYDEFIEENEDQMNTSTEEENIDEINAENDSETNNDTATGEESSEDSTEANCDDSNCDEKDKERRQEFLNKLRDLSQMLTYITLIRDNINWIKVDTLTEVYFVRQVRPLLDALNIISFASSNMSSVATNINESIFGDKKEIRTALKLSYKMNDEIDDIINALDRRLAIFLNEINRMDKNCPPFNSGRDS